MTAEIFHYDGTPPWAAFMHGHGYADGTAAASLSLRRGLDVTARVDLVAKMEGHVGKDISLAIVADAEAHTALQLQAKLPLNMFDPDGAGLLLRLRLQAELSAALSLRLSVTTDQLLVLIDPNFHGPWQDMVHMVAEEFDLGAALWARASLSAEIVAQAVLTGSFIDVGDPDRPAGFSCLLDFNAGFEAGAGISFVVNMGMPNPPRLLGRLGERGADAAAKAIEHHAHTQPAAARDAALVGAALVRLLLPVALQAGYDVARAIAITEDNKRSEAVGAIVGQLAHQSQMVVLRGLAEYAAKELGSVIAPFRILDQVMRLDDPGTVTAPLARLRDVVTQLSVLDLHTIEKFTEALLAVIEAAEGVLSLPVFDEGQVDHARHALAMLWAAGELIDTVMTVAATPGDVVSATFRALSRPLPGAATFGQVIPHQGASITMGDLVNFLGAAELLDEVFAALPWLNHVHDFLARALAPGRPFHLLETLLFDLMPPDHARLDALVADLTPVVSEGVDTIRSSALKPLMDHPGTNPELRAFLADVVDPLLDTLPVVVLPSLPHLSDDLTAIRVGEAVCGLLLQGVGKFLTETMTTLTEQAIEQQLASLQRTAEDLAMHGADASAYHELSALGLGGLLTVAEAERLVVLLADVLGDADTALHSTLPDLTTSAAAGLADPQQRRAHLAKLLTSDDAPAGVDLGGGIDRLIDSGMVLAGQVIPPLSEFAAEWAIRRIGDIGTDIGNGIGVVVQAVVTLFNNIGAEVAKYEQQFKTAVHNAELAAAAILSDVAGLAAKLRTRVDGSVGQVRARGHAIIDEIVPDLPGLRANAKTIFDHLLDEAHELVDMMLDLVEVAADAASAALTAAANTGQFAEQGVHDHVRSSVSSQSRRDFTFTVDLLVTKVTFTITSADISAAVWTLVSGSPDYGTAVRNGVQHAGAQSAAAAAAAAVKPVLDQARSAQQQVSAAQDLVPGRALSVGIESPSPNAVLPGRARLQVRLRGANQSFVEETLGVPPRVLIRLNEQSQAYAGDWWVPDGEDLVLEVQVKAARADPSLEPVPQLAGIAASGGLAGDLTGDRGGALAGPRLVRRVSVTLASLVGDSASQDRDVSSSGLAAREALPIGAHARKDDSTGDLEIHETPHKPLPPIDQTTPAPPPPARPGGGEGGHGNQGGGQGGGQHGPRAAGLWVTPLQDLPVLVGRPGLNLLQVAVVDGQGKVATTVGRFSLLPADRALHGAIRLRAYELWKSRGSGPGNATSDWFQAQREVTHAAIAARAYNYANARGGQGPDRSLEDWLRAEEEVILGEIDGG